ILVKFKQPSAAANRIEALGDDAVGQTANRVSIVRLRAGESAAARIAAYSERADVLYAEPNARVQALALDPPNDPYFSSQWAFDGTGALRGWSGRRRSSRHGRPRLTRLLLELRLAGCVRLRARSAYRFHLAGHLCRREWNLDGLPVRRRSRSAPLRRASGVDTGRCSRRS